MEDEKQREAQPERFENPTLNPREKMSKIKHIVSLSDSAFFSIVTSALEAYEICHQDDQEDGHTPTETYGNLWGYQASTKREESVFRIVQADPDISAKREPGSVSPASGAFSLKMDFVDHFFPELEYLGDFHSHPYESREVRTELALQKDELYKQSNADQKSTKALQGEGRPYRVQIISTVFKRQDIVKRESGHLKDELSCIRFQYDGFTIWIKAYVYNLNEDNSSRKVQDTNIALICPCADVTMKSINA